MTEVVYVRMKKNMEINHMQEIVLKDVASVSAPERIKKELENTSIYRVTEKDKNILVIDSFMIIEHLNKIYTHLEFQMVGPSQTIIRIQTKKKEPPILIVSVVWLLLFVGMAMTIMNFHYDVSMQEVHQKLHFLLTGEENQFPLWIQIPYSFGLGAGMLLFFNHWFKKRLNEEPSPLEVEIYNYQQDLDNYVNHHENRLNDPGNSP
ncbi:stage V sporulation protein AA [Virgibacillus sediminis]|uniref:Stage V sporulation protein AA n=1 Tax=Virgibacillus sediminis TaxID=202260 RepID=A0ABV7A671_9BACI